MKNLYKSILTFFLLAGSFVILSCEIGLGASVDTETPVIDITSPEADTIIRDKFAIRGSWSDDGEIGSASVTIRRTDKKTSTENKFNITVEKPVAGEAKGKWYAIIDPVSANIIDGAYVATVSISDKGGHTIVQDRSFVIDNHAPIIILQRPSSSKDPSTEIDSYGQNFTLVGQAADDCNISLIEMSIYGDAAFTDLKATVPLTNVPNSINLDVANYDKDDKSNDYYKIYGDIPELADKSKEFYFTLHAYDEAKRIPVDGSAPTEEDNKGNETTTYFLYETISKDSTLSKFKITDLYHMKNGTYALSMDEKERSAYSDIIKVVVGKLADPDLNIDAGRFSLNPENNPTFTVSGKEIKANTDITSVTVTNGSQIVIELATGLDGIALPSEPEAINIFAVPYNKENADAISKGVKIDDNIKIYPVTSRTKNGTGYKYIASISSSSVAKGTNKFVIGRDYLFAVEGVDAKNNNFIPNRQGAVNVLNYGFHMATSGAAPTLTITKPAGSLIYLKKGAKLEIEGLTSVDEGAPVVTVLYGNKEVAKEVFDPGTGSSEINNSYKNFNFAFTEEGGTAIYDIFDQTKTNTYNFTIKSTNDISTSANLSVIYDVEAPVVISPTITPLVKEFTDANGIAHSNVLNGTITVKGTISDNKQFDHAKYQIVQNDEVKQSNAISYDYNFKVDTKLLADKTETKLIIYAYDAAGNENKQTFVYYVDQDSDKPAIGPNTSSAWKTTSEVGFSLPKDIRDRKDQTNRISSGGSIYAKFTDDDGLDSVTFKVDKLNVGPDKDKTDIEKNIDSSTISGDNLQEATLSHKMPEESGYYLVTITAKDYRAKDAAGNPVNDDPVREWSISTIILITGINPEFTLTNNTEYIQYSDALKNPLSLTANITTGQAPYILTVSELDENGKDVDKKVIKLNENESPYTFDYTPENTLALSENNRIIKITVRDDSDGTSTKQVPYYVDNNPPKLTISSPVNKTGKDSINKDEKTNFRFFGSIEEKEALSGVYYKIVAQNNGIYTEPEKPKNGDLSKASSWTDSGWTAVSTTLTGWNFYQTFAEKNNAKDGEIEEGNYTIYLYAVDKAKNLSSIASSEFHVDMAAPVITAEAPAFVKHTDSNNGIVTIAGTIVESNGIASFTVNDSDIKNSILNGTWTYSVTPGEGEFTYKFKAVDLVGKEAEIEKKVIVDTTAPSVNEVSKFVIPTSEQTEQKLFKFEGLAGSITDNGPDGKSFSSGYKEIYIDCTNDQNANNTKLITLTPNDDGSWNTTLEFAKYPAIFNTQGTKYLKINIVDNAGNESGWQTIGNFIYDTARPNISITKPAADEITNKEYITVSGKAWDTYGIANDGIKLQFLDKTNTKKASINFSVNAISEPAGDNWSIDIYSKLKTFNEWTANATYTVGTGIKINSKYYICKTDHSVAEGGTFDSTKENWKEVLYLEDGIYSVKATAKDESGKDDGKNISVGLTIDTTAPTGTLQATQQVIWTDSSSRNWYKSEQIKVQVTEIETDVSGVETVEAQTISKKDSNVKSGFTTLTRKTTSDVNGNITAICYEGYVTAASQGGNDIVIRMTDKAGNIGTKTASGSEATVPVYIDTEAPDSANFVLNKVDGKTGITQKLTNRKNNVSIIMTLIDKDDLTPISKISLNKTGAKSEEVTAPINDGDDKGKWLFTINKDDLPTTSGSLVLKVEDNLGNYVSYAPLSFQVDTNPPLVSFGTIPSADKTREGIYVNRIIKIPVNASDAEGLDTSSITLKYATGTNAPADADAWKAITSTITVTDGIASFDTTTLKDATDSSKPYTGNLYLHIEAQDLAGNKASENSNSKPDLTIIVDQDTDRPIIKINNLSLGTEMCTKGVNSPTNELYGIVTDDDGIDTMEYIVSQQDENEYVDVTSKTITPDNGSFTISDLPDGQIRIKFIIKDTDGFTFTSNPEPTETNYNTLTPKIIDAKLEESKKYYGSKDMMCSALKLRVDTKPPVNGTVKYAVSGSDGTYAVPYTGNFAEKTFGGLTKKFKAGITAWDKNGIESITLIIPPAKTEDTNAPAATKTAWKRITEKDKDGKDVFAGYSFDLEKEETVDTSKLDKLEGNVPEYWITKDEIDISALVSSSRTCRILVSDGTKTTTDSFTLAIDNDKPVIEIKTPSSTQYSSGNVTSSGTVDSAEHMYYAISTDNTTAISSDETAAASGTAITTWKKEDGTTGETSINIKPYYKEIPDYGFNWYVYFDDTTSAASAHDHSLKQILIDYGITTDAKIKDKSFTDIVQLYLWIKGVDAVGNETEEKHLILVDPQGDAPTVTIDYPEVAGKTLGGEVTVRGSAIDTIGTKVGVDSVWLQFISAKENGYTSLNKTQDWTTGGFQFTDTVTKYEIENNVSYTHTITPVSFEPTLKDVWQWIDNKYPVYTKIGDENPVAVTSKPYGDESASGKEYYIKTTFQGSAWSLKINGKDELNPIEGDINPVMYRVYAKDKDNNLSRLQESFGVFDSDNPVISNIYLRQYDENKKIIASRPYTADMWIKGNWYLCGSVRDTQGISELKIGGEPYELSDDDKKAGAVVNFEKLLETTPDSAGPVKINGKDVTVEATDNATNTKHTTSVTYAINYDNKDPNPKELSITKIQNSNGFFTFGSKVTEDPIGANAQSGFSYLAFWFERDISGKHVVYDIMRTKKDHANEIQYDSLAKENGLVWKEKTVTRSSNLGTLILTEGNDNNIHVGGLCKISGAIYFINSVNGTSIGLNGQPELPDNYKEDDDSTKNQTVLFAMANVVNNNIESGTGTKSYTDDLYGYYSNVGNDDGDHMVESVLKSGTTWTWEANINSQNIPDGTVKLHYVAFDAAGNFKDGVINTQVANNAPRLAGLEVWSDYNEDGKKDDGEFDVKYYNPKKRWITSDKSEYRATDLTDLLIVSGNNADYKENGSSFFTIKAKTTLTPELVGGNEDLYYSYKFGNADDLDDETKSPLKYPKDSIGKGHYDGIDDEADTGGYLVTDVEGSSYIKGNKDISIILDDELLSTIPNTTTTKQGATPNSDPTWFEYTIYDSTEGSKTWDGTVANVDSENRLSATFRVALNIQYTDETEPNVVIDKFHWNGKNDNSLYENKSSNGHIELEDELPAETFTSTGSGVYDRDPKVSGKINVTGYAYDNIRLGSLKLSVTNSAGTAIMQNSKLPNSTVVAIYDKAWFDSSTESKTGLTKGTIASDGWYFTVTSTGDDVFNGENGHKVKWTLSLDTEKITGVAAADIKVKVEAVDKAGFSSNDREINNDESASLAEKNNPIYKMDVVPYITTVETSLSSIKETNPTVYSRTALGHYPVWTHKDSPTSESEDYSTSAETVYFYGFNLEGGSAVDADNHSETLTMSTRETAYSTFGNKRFSASVGTLSTGNIKVTVGTGATAVSSLNNLNKDIEYNMQPNGDNNNNLDDNVVFDIWELNAKAARPRSAGDDVTSAAMTINPSSKMLNFAFANGSTFFSFADGTKNSYKTWKHNWDDFVGSAIVATSAGKTHGTTIGQDTNATESGGKGQSSSFNIISSNWGVSSSMESQAKDEYEGWKTRRLEKLGMWGFAESTSTSTSQIINKRRIQSPSPVISSYTQGDIMYLAYSDITNNQIRFRWGKIASNSSNDPENNGQIVDIGTKELKDAEKTNYSIVSGYAESVTEKAGRTPVNSTRFGNFVSIDVIQGEYQETETDGKKTYGTTDTVVLVWYDGTAKKLWYTYKTNPCNDNDAGNSTTNFGERYTDGTWSTPLQIFSGAGEYCKIKVDSNSGIHIAAYDGVSADLKYAYLSSYTDRSPKTSLIDSTDILGTNITLDVAKTGDKQIPYIGYYGGSIMKPKLAFLSDTGTISSTSVDAGVSNNAYTGKWEVTIIPTSSKMVNGQINVGIWKNGASKTYSTTDGNVPTTGDATNIGKSYSTSASGVCYGNGTDNTVLGYAITNDSGTGGTIETAQMK